MADDYYETLGVPRAASQDEIKKAFRKKVRELHPDRNPGDSGAEERFKAANEAYAVLSDPEQRTKYDAVGTEAYHSQVDAEEIFRNVDFGQIFEELGLGGLGFGAGGRGPRVRVHTRGGRAGPTSSRGPFGRGGARPARGRDVEHEVEIGLEEALRGSTRVIRLQQPDGSAETVEVPIPAGVDTGKKVRVRGKGLSGAPGGARGDLYLKVKVAPHPHLRRRGRNLEIDATVPLSTFLLGGAVTVRTLDGERTLKVPAGVSPGMKLRMRGLGAPALGRPDRRGDLHVVLRVQIPSELSEAQREAAEALKRSGL